MNKLFKRKIWKEMEDWKDNLSDGYALLVEGARRVGKTTIVRQFVEKNFDSHIFIDFSQKPSKAKELVLEYGSSDLDGFFLNLQKMTNTALIEKKSVIVFDEVQFCKEAREMIKHLVADGRYRYIETGSLISIRQNVKDILIPSEEHRIQMYPMDFEEFLWATNDNVTMDFIRKKFTERKPMGRIAHNDTMRSFRLYMLIGGMPQAVSAYLDKNNFDAIEDAKENILDLYYDDLEKLNVGSEKCKDIFRNIPGLLSRHDKSFKPCSVRKNTRYSDYAGAINSLRESKTVNICRRCSDPGPAPGLNEDEEKLKIYMADTGLLFTAAFRANIGDKDDIYEMILRNKMNVNRGMFFENSVAQELKSSGHMLYFSKFITDDSVNVQEVDFVVAKNGDIIPIDVKSGRSNSHVSLDRFRKKYAKRIRDTYVVHTKDIRIDEDGVVYIPAYMACLIGR